MTRLKLGDRVKPSAYALESKRQYVLLQGRHSDKVRAQGWYDRARAKRGTVTAVDDSGVSVAWDDGTRSDCLDYVIESATDSTGGQK